MSTNAPPTLVPSTSEFTTAWVTYALFGLGAFLWWPAAIGVVVAHVRQGAAAAGFIRSHYGWLIRTFWWSTLFYLLALAVTIGSAWPLVRDILRSAVRSGPNQWELNAGFNLDWSSIFATVGGATAGGIGILVIWCWFIYRVVRGAIRLADAQPAP